MLGAFSPSIGGQFNRIVTLSGTVYNYDVGIEISKLGWNGVSPVHITVNIQPGTKVGSTSILTYALTVPVLPNGSIVRIINKGIISGMGGRGSQTGVNHPYSATDGGPALLIKNDVIIDNQGVIQGGGGGGGGDGSYSGGGGAGIPPGLGGAPYGGSYVGLNGTVNFGGMGYNNYTAVSGGEPGKNGSTPNGGYPSGAGGHYVDGYSFITWEAIGTVYGAYT